MNTVRHVMFLLGAALLALPAVADHHLPPAQEELYDLATDLSETKNLAAEHPDLVAEMSAKIDAIRAKGKSRP